MKCCYNITNILISRCGGSSCGGNGDSEWGSNNGGG